MSKAVGPLLFSTALSFGRRAGIPWLWGALAACSHVLAQIFVHAAAIGGRDADDDADDAVEGDEDEEVNGQLAAAAAAPKTE